MALLYVLSTFHDPFVLGKNQSARYMILTIPLSLNDSTLAKRTMSRRQVAKSSPAAAVIADDAGAAAAGSGQQQQQQQQQAMSEATGSISLGVLDAAGALLGIRNKRKYTPEAEDDIWKCTCGEVCN